MPIFKRQKIVTDADRHMISSKVGLTRIRLAQKCIRKQPRTESTIIPKHLVALENFVIECFVWSREVFIAGDGVEAIEGDDVRAVVLGEPTRKHTDEPWVVNWLGAEDRSFEFGGLATCICAGPGCIVIVGALHKVLTVGQHSTNKFLVQSNFHFPMD